MKTNIINFITEGILKNELVNSIESVVNQYNKQVESLIIVFEPGTNPNYSHIVTIIETIENLVNDEGYGDLTETDIKISTYHELEDDLTISWTFQFSIDS
jgi:hypothetical protein